MYHDSIFVLDPDSQLEEDNPSVHEKVVITCLLLLCNSFSEVTLLYLNFQSFGFKNGKLHFF